MGAGISRNLFQLTPARAGALSRNRIRASSRCHIETRIYIMVTIVTKSRHLRRFARLGLCSVVRWEQTNAVLQMPVTWMLNSKR